jgi:hypothetical protein
VGKEDSEEIHSTCAEKAKEWGGCSL